MNYAITLETNPRPEDVRAIDEGLTKYNLQFAPPNPFTPLTIVVRDEQEKVVGGIVGGTFWGWLHIDLFWLDENARHQSIGAQILEMAEREALARGCHHAFLDTMSFQARGFYEKFGYVVYGVLDDFPMGHQRYWMKKELRG